MHNTRKHNRNRTPINLPGFFASAVLLMTAGFCAPRVAGGVRQSAGGQDAAKEQKVDSSAAEPSGEKLVEMKIKLPKPAFKGTPKHVPPGTNLEPPRRGPREPFLAPPGVKSISEGKPVTASDSEPIIGEIKFITDGKREATEGGYVELGPGVQWVQIDLREAHRIYAVMLWHYHASARVYHDVVIQVADDPDFITNVRTIYNNDHDNSAGLGIGDEKEYWETYEGRLIEGKGVTARYVRLYSNGSTEDDQNHYTEVEVYGLPAK